MMAINSERKENDRNGLIDIYRLLMAVIIMVFHSYHLYEIKQYPFMYGRIFVEAFFALSGYFTVCHFEKAKLMGGHSNAVVEAIKYTIKKYRAIFPYTFIAVLASLVGIHAFVKEDISWFMVLRAIFESLMIIRGDSNVGVLWYLAAMLPILPVLAIFVQKTPIKVYGTLSLIYVFLWYFVLGRYDDVFVPISYLRAICGLALGVLVYCLKLFIENRLDVREDVFTAIMAICMACPIVLTAFDIKTDRLILIMFLIAFAISFSSKTKKIVGNRFTSLCGKIFLPLYLVHLNVADMIDHICRHYIVLNCFLQYILYFFITLIGTIILMYAGQMFDRLLRKVGI